MSPPSSPSGARRVLRRLRWVVLAVGVAISAWYTTGPAWEEVLGAPHGRDFASYYYAVEAASRGLDPYSTPTLASLAREEGTRRSVHPFFYPPPYLLTMLWVLPLELAQAYQVWFWLDSLFLIAVLLALANWLPKTPVMLASGVLVASFTPIFDTHWMGQANLAVLALCAWALVLAERERPGWAGALMGLACMMKMSPAVLVAWWLVRGRFKAVAAACGAAVVLTVLSLWWVGPAIQWRFYTQVLPGFETGDYNGLTVPITLFANHSIPNLWVQLFPDGKGFSDLARLATRVSGPLILGGALFLLRKRDLDPVSAACAAGALLVPMLMVPVFTYEHHMSFLIVSWTAVVAALWQGRLGRAWAVALALAYVAAAWQLRDVKALAMQQGPLVRWGLQEVKCAAALLLGVACAIAARRGPPAESEATEVAAG